MQTLWAQIQTVLWNVFNRPTIADVLDILIVAFLLYELLMLTKETRASAVLKGLVTLVVASWVSDLLGLTALNWVLLNVVNNGTVVLVILFQPELRKALEQLGRGAIHKTAVSADLEESSHIVNEITSCLLTLSRRRVGALIVIEQRIGLKDIIETGTSLNSQISAALLENIRIMLYGVSSWGKPVKASSFSRSPARKSRKPDARSTPTAVISPTRVGMIRKAVAMPSLPPRIKLSYTLHFFKSP